MGHPMAWHLGKRGHAVTVYRPHAPPRPQQWAGRASASRSARRRARAQRQLTSVFACVGNDDDLRSVALAARRRARRNDTGRGRLVDHTTASATIARELGAAAKRHGLSASSMRRSPAARPAPATALLTVMCGGEPAAFDAVRSRLIAVRHAPSC